MTRVRWIICGVVLTAAFLALGLLVARQPLALDTEVAVALQGKDTQPAGRVAGVLTNFLGPVLPYVLGAALLVFVLFRRHHLVLGLKLAVVLVLCRLTSTDSPFAAVSTPSMAKPPAVMRAPFSSWPSSWCCAG